MTKCSLFSILLLLSLSACARSQESPPLEVAIEKQNYPLADKLLSSGEDPNEKDAMGATPLTCAVFNDDTMALKLLLSHRANIHTPVPPMGGSLLELCVSLNKFHAAKYLITHGLNPDTIGTLGETPLDKAIQADKILMVSFLLGNGSNPNSISVMGSLHLTPLGKAFQERWQLSRIRSTMNRIKHQDTTTEMRQERNLQIIQMLLKSGASIKAPFPLNNGNTYLHDATDECDTSVVTLLLKYGADKNARNDAGERPYDLAVKNGCSDLEEILK